MCIRDSSKEVREISFDTEEEEDEYLLAGTSVVVADGRPGQEIDVYKRQLPRIPGVRPR